MNNLDSINKYFKSLFSDSANNKNEKINKIKKHYSTGLYESKRLNEVYPQKNETKSDFINRFMRVTAKEYPDVKQRYAVANSYWDNRDKKKLNESARSSEIIDAVKKHFVVDNYPILGPSFLLPDGSFIDLIASFNSSTSFEDFPAHAEVEDFLQFSGLSNVSGDIIDGSPSIQGLGAIRLNDLEDNNYIELPESNLTLAQYDSLEGWLDKNSRKRDTVVVSDLGFNNYVEYNYSDYLPEDIIKRIKRYYSSGHLYESIHNTTSKAVAVVSGSPDYSYIEGKVVFTQKEDTVDVEVDLVNLPQSQFLGFHIHSGAECTGNEEDPFKNAKAHFNPSRKSHPDHAGDLPALYSSNGQIHTTFETDKFTVADIIGKTIIIHSDRDDFTSQPAGDAGSKIACGVIEKCSLDEAYLDPEEKFWDYRTKEISGNQYIDTTRNEIRWVDDMLEDPEYYRERKGYISKIIEMSPKEYFEVCAELFGTSVEAQKRQIAADTSILDNLTQVIKKYKKRFPIPFINIKDRTQEGRHRMYVLGELLGWDKKFPVLIIQDINNKRV